MQQLVISTKLRKATREDDFDQISNSVVATTTCLTATNWSKEILKQFDIVCIDEAAFAPDWLTMPLVLSDIPRLILSGDHHQLPPVTGLWWFSYHYAEYLRITPYQK